MRMTVIIGREGTGYVSLCPEFDIASQGNSTEEARDNLREAIELFLETASPAEVRSRRHEEVFAQGFREVRRKGSHVVLQRIGTLQSIIRQAQVPRSLFETD